MEICSENDHEQQDYEALHSIAATPVVVSDPDLRLPPPRVFLARAFPYTESATCLTFAGLVRVTRTSPSRQHSALTPSCDMLSEHAGNQGQGQQAARAVGETLSALGFEPSQGGQSYGLEEVSIYGINLHA